MEQFESLLHSKMECGIWEGTTNNLPNTEPPRL
jgi:hypothetical protein